MNGINSHSTVGIHAVKCILQKVRDWPKTQSKAVRVENRPRSPMLLTTKKNPRIGRDIKGHLIQPLHK